MSQTFEPEALEPEALDGKGLAARLAHVRERVERAARRAQRSPEQITLVAVSKTHPIEALLALYDLGVRDFGESYVQEWAPKAAVMPQDVRWHLIGHLQTNKVKALGQGVALIHSVDREGLILELDRRMAQPVEFLLQVNIATEQTKHGCAPAQAQALLELALTRPKLTPRGLMAVPPYAQAPGDNDVHFKALAALRAQLEALVLQARGPHAASRFDLLSMGMTADFESAIAHGATHVRVGTALFGERDYSGAGR